jgi:hypothetical protein
MKLHPFSHVIINFCRLNIPYITNNRMKMKISDTFFFNQKINIYYFPLQI